MPTIRKFEQLDAWQSARVLTREVYGATERQPFSRDFALRDQIRRAAVSVMSNIAEGFESRTRPLCIEFLGRAKASAGEVRSQLYIAQDVGHIDQALFDELADLAAKCSSQVQRLMSYLETDVYPSAREELPEFPI